MATLRRVKTGGSQPSLWLTCIGGGIVTLSVFLPLVQPAGPFAQIRDNTPIQHGAWLTLVLGIGLAIPYRPKWSNWGKAEPFVPLVACGVIAWQLVRLATNEKVRTLYSVAADGSINTDGPSVVAPLGISAYVTGVGTAIAAVGAILGIMSIQSPKTQALLAQWNEEDRAATEKQCPDCAETVLKGARVCKHCGFRFAEPAQGA